MNNKMDAYTTDLETYLSNILQWAKTYFNEETFINAKKYFFRHNGKIFDDEIFYEQRMNFFIDYFLFQTPVVHEDNIALTPYHLYLTKISSPDESFKFVYSVFKIIHRSDCLLKIVDLINIKKYEIYPKKNQTFIALQKNNIFQGFIYHIKNKYYLSDGIFFHPSKSQKLILNLTKKIQSNKNSLTQIFSLLNHLSKAQMTILRQPHLSISKVYEYKL